MVNIKDITDGKIDGNGVFDELMKSVKAHLKEEYDSQRIRGSEYTQVYIASIQAAMQQSIEWYLGAEIAKNQALLLEKQIEGQEKQNELLAEQKEQLIAQTELIRVQTANAEAEGELIPHQKELLIKQGMQVAVNIDLLEQQTLTEVENTKTAKFNIDEMLPVQKSIMEQKLITEQAQTQDVSDKGPITGIVGAQVELYKKQKDGYDRNAEQQAVRALTDTYGVITASDSPKFPWAVSNENITSAMEALRQNAGLGAGTQAPEDWDIQ